MVTAAKTNGARRAAALAPYFTVQLEFAGRMAALTGLSLADALAQYTNLHRRFGYGKISVQGLDPRWREFVTGYEQYADATARLAFTVDWYATAPPMAAYRPGFGCFSFDPPDAAGVVRIHFNPTDTAGGVGPLHRSKLEARRAEVRTMIEHVVAAHPAARTLRGVSWLYNLDAYRRVFPPAYAASVTEIDGGIRYEGMSSWGQFLDHRGAVKPEMIEAFRVRLPTLDADAPWRTFPLPALRAEAPLDEIAGSSDDA